MQHGVEHGKVENRQKERERKRRKKHMVTTGGIWGSLVNVLKISVCVCVITL